MTARQNTQDKTKRLNIRQWRRIAALTLILLCAAPICGSAEEKPSSGLISQTVRPEAADYVHEVVQRRVEEDLAAETYLSQGLALVFLFEGAGRLEDPTQRLFGLCLVVRLDETGEPRIVYENNASTSIPDHPINTYDTVDCATLPDGVYDLYTDNRVDGGVLSVEKRGCVQVLRFNSKTLKGKQGYLDQGTDIQFHYRKEEMNTGANTLKPYSRGCLMVGIGQEDFGRFMNSVLDTRCRISVPYPFFTLGKDKNLLAGQLILDRSLAREYLVSIYGEKGTLNILNEQETEP